MSVQRIAFGQLPADALKTLLPLAAWLALLAVTARDLAQFVWKTPENSFAPWLLLIAMGLLAHHALRFNWQQSNPSRSERALALLLLALGAPGFALGHALQLELVNAAASLLLMAGVITWTGGVAAQRALRFPIFFCLLALPYPAWWVSSMTGPIKVLISQAVEFILYQLDFPVARDGVILALGPYRMLVADACSGLNSLIFLLALGLLYMHFTGHRPRWHRLLLALLLIPLAIMANGIRVLMLALITYYLGDAAGQSFLHDAAGLVLFMSGYVGLLLADTLLKKMHPIGRAQSSPPLVHARTGWPGVNWANSATLTALLVLTGMAGLWLKPNHYLAQTNPLPPLSQLVPETMGQWETARNSENLLIVPGDESLLKELYHQTLSRIYTNPQGQFIMLSVAYGGHQFGNELQAHRPEACYRSSGFELLQSHDVSLPLKEASLKVRQLVALRRDRIEPITYWMTVGETPTLPGLDRKWVQFQYGWAGQVPDGFLVRVSSIDKTPERAFELQADFIAAMQHAGLGRMGLPLGKNSQ